MSAGKVKVFKKSDIIKTSMEWTISEMLLEMSHEFEYGDYSEGKLKKGIFLYKYVDDDGEVKRGYSMSGMSVEEALGLIEVVKAYLIEKCE